MRGKDFCRACDSPDMLEALNLGSLPIANELLLRPGNCESFPLELRVCRQCALGQVADVVTSTRLFRDYRYLSSISNTFLLHAKEYCEQVLKDLDWKPDDWVLEIASNDGYLLKNFREKGLKVLGVEPAENIARLALARGIPTISEFFGSSLARNILEKNGHPRLIVANNVYAHVPDIQDFTIGLQILMNDRTAVSIENPSIMNLLNDLQFDSIYHEHFSYLSATTVNHLAQASNLTLTHLEQIPTHGGSNRYWIRKGRIQQSKMVEDKIEQELIQGITSIEHWSQFRLRVERIVNEFRNFIHEKKKLGEVVAGYGAAAKASTLINAAKLEANDIAFIIDESPEKIGRFMPSSCVPIVSLDQAKSLEIGHIVIFPWNLSSEISSKIRKLFGEKVSVWRAIPRLEKI
jgi:C-methyltransferase C-terminal domain/Putative zinc binding domain/Methyltransferase domain